MVLSRKSRPSAKYSTCHTAFAVSAAKQGKHVGHTTWWEGKHLVFLRSIELIQKAWYQARRQQLHNEKKNKGHQYILCQVSSISGNTTGVQCGNASPCLPSLAASCGGRWPARGAQPLLDSGHKLSASQRWPERIWTRQAWPFGAFQHVSHCCCRNHLQAFHHLLVPFGAGAGLAAAAVQARCMPASARTASRLQSSLSMQSFAGTVWNIGVASEARWVGSGGPNRIAGESPAWLAQLPALEAFQNPAQKCCKAQQTLLSPPQEPTRAQGQSLGDILCRSAAGRDLSESAQMGWDSWDRSKLDMMCCSTAPASSAVMSYSRSWCSMARKHKQAAAAEHMAVRHPVPAAVVDS